jgi:hypothetical protein
VLSRVSSGPQTRSCNSWFARLWSDGCQGVVGRAKAVLHARKWFGFYWTGSQVIISTATTSPKVAALSARPDVAVSIDAGDTPGGARALSVRGRASVEIVDGVVEEYLAMARISMEPEAAAEFEQNVRGKYEQMARIAITPILARFYDFGAGRMPRFLQEPSHLSMSYCPARSSTPASFFSHSASSLDSWYQDSAREQQGAYGADSGRVRALRSLHLRERIRYSGVAVQKDIPRRRAELIAPVPHRVLLVEYQDVRNVSRHRRAGPGTGPVKPTDTVAPRPGNL